MNTPFLLLSIGSGYYVEKLAHGMSVACRPQGISFSWMKVAEFDEYRAKGGRVRGIAVYADSKILEKLWGKLGRQIPMVGLRANRVDEPIPTVLPDGEGIGRTIAEHLIAEGAEDFLFVGPPDEGSEAKKRGFQRALRAAGLNFRRFDSGNAEKFWGSDFGCGHRFLGRVAKLRRPLGVFAVNDRLAASCIECVRLLKWTIPGDVAIVGVEDHPVFAQHQVALSSFRIDIEAIGKLAVEVLRDLEEKGSAPLRCRVGGELIVRESSRLRLMRDANVASVLEYIDTHLGERSSLSDLARRSGLSRAVFTARFRRATGESVQQFIIHRRVKYARELLQKPDLSIAEIAQIAGFESASYFTRIFKRRMHLTPSEYRNGFAETKGSGIVLKAPYASPGLEVSGES